MALCSAGCHWRCDMRLDAGLRVETTRSGTRERGMVERAF